MPAKIIEHKFKTPILDSADSNLVRPSNWNDDHDFWFGNRRVIAATDAIAHSDHLSTVVYDSPTGVVATIPPPSAPENFRQGWKTQLYNVGAGAVTLRGSGGASINDESEITLDRGTALDLHSIGTLSYIGAFLTGGASGGGSAGRLEYVSATELRFRPHNGDKIIIDSDWHDIPASGISGLRNTGVYIDGVAGQNLAPDTSYFVYAFVDTGDVLTAEFSSTGHETSSTLGNVGTEIKIGDETRSLFGFVHTDTAAEFLDQETHRWVLSWFNRRAKALKGASTASAGTGSVMPPNLAEINANSRVHFLTWGDEAILITTSGYGSPNIAQHVFFNIGLNGANPQLDPFDTQMVVNNSWPNNVSCVGFITATEGAHYLTPLGAIGAAGYTAAYLTSVSAIIHG